MIQRYLTVNNLLQAQMWVLTDNNTVIPYSPQSQTWVTSSHDRPAMGKNSKKGTKSEIQSAIGNPIAGPRRLNLGFGALCDHPLAPRLYIKISRSPQSFSPYLMNRRPNRRWLRAPGTKSWSSATQSQIWFAIQANLYTFQLRVKIAKKIVDYPRLIAGCRRSIAG